MYNLTIANFVQLSLYDLWGRALNILPDLVGAFVVILVGFIIAPVLGGIVKRMIDLLRIDDLADKAGVKDLVKGYSDNFSISLVIGKLVKWFFILAFLMAAADILQWTTVTQFLNEIMMYIPKVLVSIIILVLGMITGSLFDVIVTKSLKGSNAPVEKPELMGKLTKWSFVVFSILVALAQLGVAISLIQILFAGIVLALSLAFGLGGRKKAEEILDNIGPKFKKNGKK